MSTDDELGNKKLMKINVLDLPVGPLVCQSEKTPQLSTALARPQ